MASLRPLWLLACISSANRYFEARVAQLDGQELGSGEGPDSGRRCFATISIEDDASPGNQIEVRPLADIMAEYDQINHWRALANRAEWVEKTRGLVLCKGVDWMVDLCPRPCPADVDCWVKKTRVGSPSCLEKEDQQNIRLVPTSHGGKPDAAWFDEHFIYQEPHAVHPIELPLDSKQQPTDEDPCPTSPGIYRSDKCDNRKDDEMQGINHFEIPPGKGMCADKQCYHVDDLADLAKRAYEGLGVFKLPHNNRDTLQPYEKQELGLSTDRRRDILLIPSYGCEWISRMTRLREARPLSEECTGPMVSLDALKSQAAGGGATKSGKTSVSSMT